MASVGVVGGGIVGLATAWTLTSRGHDVILFEKESTFAAHQTGHNSGVVHAGPYYRPGSHKAEMCIAGNRSMIAFARENGIAHEVCGKLIVATHEAELPRLEALRERAVANGVPVDAISGGQAREIEPHVRAVQALQVHSTGIIDYGEVSETLARLAVERGADLRRGHMVTGIHSNADGRITIESSQSTAHVDALVNCAGLYSDRVAKMAGLKPTARIVPFRGEYYELAPERRDLVRNLIYPVPDPDLPFLGVHFTRMIDGAVHAGPNAVLALSREGYSWSQMRFRDTFDAVTYPGFLRMARRNVRVGMSEVARSLSKRRFARSLAELVPDVTEADLVPSGAGIRAQAVLRDGQLVDDFLIERAPRQVHVLNAPSPAATASLEIATYIADEAEAALAGS